MAVLADPPWSADPVWAAQVAALASFPGGLRVLELCAGAGTACLALQALLGREKVSLAGAWDVDGSLAAVHKVVHGQEEALHLGPVAGDILRTPDSSFPDAHIVVAGPPCPPWSSIGQRGSFSDPRSSPFLRVVDILGQLARRESGAAPLVLFVLGNVEGIRHRAGGSGRAPLGELMDRLGQALPSHWALSWSVLASTDYGLPQSRRRVFVVGRNTLRAGPPAAGAPPPFRLRVQPRDLLDREASGSGPSRYTALQQGNLAGFKAWYAAEMADPARKGQLAFVDVSRDVSG
jgi:DNA (cytosine-5)-methyltransferase 1